MDLRSHSSRVETQEWGRWFVCRYIVHFLSIDLVFPSSSVIFPASSEQRSDVSTPSPALGLALFLMLDMSLRFAFAFPWEGVQPICPLLQIGGQTRQPATCGFKFWPGLKLPFLDPESAQTCWKPLLGPTVLLNEGCACLMSPVSRPTPSLNLSLPPAHPSPRCQRQLLGEASLTPPSEGYLHLLLISSRAPFPFPTVHYPVYCSVGVSLQILNSGKAGPEPCGHHQSHPSTGLAHMKAIFPAQNAPAFSQSGPCIGEGKGQRREVMGPRSHRRE